MSTTNKTGDPVKALQLHQGEIAFYKQEGYLCIPGLISSEETAVLRNEVVSIMDTIGLGTTKLKQTHQYLAGSSLDALVNSEKLSNLAGQLLGGPSSLYLPFTAVKSNGGGQFHFHQDNQYTRLDGPALNFWIALNDMTPENGCLQVIPRSHLNGTLNAQESVDNDGHKMIDWQPDDFFPVRMNAGDCLAFSRLTVHGSGLNETDDLRVAYAIQMHRNDVNWLQPDGSWLNVKEHPRFPNVGPTQEITAPTNKLDGH